MVLGIPSSPRLVMPVHDPLFSEEEKPQKFIDWVTGYWDALRTPEAITTEALLGRSDVYKSTGDYKYLNTALKQQEDEMEFLVAPKAYFRVGATLTIGLDIYAENLRRALFDTDGQWNHLRVVAIWPDMSVWPCHVAYKGLTEMLQPENSRNDGTIRRNVEMVQVSNANHLVSGSYIV